MLYLYQATKLKYDMIQRYFHILILFFVTEIIFQGLMPLGLEYFEKSLYFTTTLDLTQQIFDFAIYTLLLMNYRVREWPQYFLIASFEIVNLNQFIDDGNSRVIPDIYKAKITRSFLEDDTQSVKKEFESMILNSVSEDSESNMVELNVILLNPSMEETGSPYDHFTVGKRLHNRSVDTSASLPRQKH